MGDPEPLYREVVKNARLATVDGMTTYKTPCILSAYMIRDLYAELYYDEHNPLWSEPINAQDYITYSQDGQIWYYIEFLNGDSHINMVLTSQAYKFNYEHRDPTAPDPEYEEYFQEPDTASQIRNITYSKRSSEIAQVQPVYATHKGEEFCRYYYKTDDTFYQMIPDLIIGYVKEETTVKIMYQGMSLPEITLLPSHPIDNTIDGQLLGIYPNDRTQAAFTGYRGIMQNIQEVI